MFIHDSRSEIGRVIDKAVFFEFEMKKLTTSKRNKSKAKNSIPNRPHASRIDFILFIHGENIKIVDMCNKMFSKNNQMILFSYKQPTKNIIELKNYYYYYMVASTSLIQKTL